MNILLQLILFKELKVSHFQTCFKSSGFCLKLFLPEICQYIVLKLIILRLVCFFYSTYMIAKTLKHTRTLVQGSYHY